MIKILILYATWEYQIKTLTTHNPCYNSEDKLREPEIVIVNVLHHQLVQMECVHKIATLTLACLNDSEH